MAPCDQIGYVARVLRTSAAPRPYRVSKGEIAMWETVQDNPDHLSHDMPCHRCGHAMHTYLACSDACDCEPASMPGAAERRLVNA